MGSRLGMMAGWYRVRRHVHLGCLQEEVVVGVIVVRQAIRAHPVVGQPLGAPEGPPGVGQQAVAEGVRQRP